ncbi:hypothetical protein TrRE_jg10703, partial [Triparma retinervis]
MSAALKKKSAQIESLRSQNAKLKNQLLLEVHSDKAHDELKSTLVEKGAIQDLMVETVLDVKRAHVGLVVHDSPKAVVDYLMEEDTESNFKRHILNPKEDIQKEGRIMLWQHAVNGGNKVIEYLLCLRMKREKDSGFAVEIKSIQETELKKNVLEKHDELVSRTNKRILSRRARIEGELKIIEFEFGQASLTFAGTLEAQGGKQIAKFITTQTLKRN